METKCFCLGSSFQKHPHYGIQQRCVKLIYDEGMISTDIVHIIPKACMYMLVHSETQKRCFSENVSPPGNIHWSHNEYMQINKSCDCFPATNQLIDIRRACCLYLVSISLFGTNTKPCHIAGYICIMVTSVYIPTINLVGRNLRNKCISAGLKPK